MRELVFDLEQINVKLYGKEFVITMPTLAQAQAYANKVKDKTDEESTELLYEYLEALGIPVEESKKIQVGHLEELIRELMPSKKK